MKFLIGNIKMNLISSIERENYFKGIENSLMGRKFKEVQVIICPPFIHLEKFKDKFEKQEIISLGGQNIYSEQKGRFTGEVSAPMIKNFGGDYVIIGHSERRAVFGETDELINKKLKAALDSNLIPILCIGETLAEREQGEIKKVISSQLTEGLRDISKNKISQMIIAYEPIWSIGTGRIPKTNEIMEVRILIQKILIDNFDMELESIPKIVYGGSVDFGNAKNVCIEAGMNGVLVGGESLHPMDFIKIGEVLENN